MEKPVIYFRGVSLEYRSYKSSRQLLAHELLGMNKGTPQSILERVSFEIFQGEKVALVGDGGTERDAITELIAGLASADKGKIRIRGRVASAITFAAGFDKSLTVEDNVDYKAHMLGWDRKKIRNSWMRILKNAELFEKRGFKLKDLKATEINRLGLHMFAEEDADIYVVNCNLNVGNAAHRQAGIDVLRKLTGSPEKTLVISNKYQFYGKKLCNRAMTFANSKLVFDGNVKDAVEFYKNNYAVSI